MRVPTSVRPALTTTTPATSSPRRAPDFACVKVRARPDEVLAALAPHVTGTPRDLLGTIRGEAPLPADGRGSERRAILYRLERDAWTTILREGDRFAGCDVGLARWLAATLGTRALALFLDGAGLDLTYDVFERDAAVASVFHAAGHDLETSGDIDREAVARDPAAHAREWLRREDATNDRLAFRHFELPGVLRGRWDLALERCVLLPGLATALELGSKPKTRRIAKPATPPQGLTREGERGVRSVLLDLIQQNTQGF